MNENETPGAMSPELKLLSFAVTVWTERSLLVQVTVLLTPITTVIVAGEYPGEAVFVLVPFGMLTFTGSGAARV